MSKFPFNYITSLYRRDNKGTPCIWSIETDGDKIIIYHGKITGSILRDTIKSNNITVEVNRKINDKRKSGYKYLNELKDNGELPVEESLCQYLNTYLPFDRTTSDGTMLHMLAKTFDNANNKLFKNDTIYIGQWKINGLRCFISATTENSDMFRPIRLKFQSREGTYWNSLSSLEDSLLHLIPNAILDKMLIDNWKLDGEVYLPGKTVNEINHIVKDPNCKENDYIQFWLYDIAIEDCIQATRTEIIDTYFGGYNCYFNDKNSHLSNSNRLVTVSNYFIKNEESAVLMRDEFIDLGFEGLIMRNPNAEYQYGKRNASMIKFKKATDGRFKILDIYPEGIKRQDIPLFKCQNDINDATFEVRVGGTMEYQKNVLRNKEQYIGKMMFVEYGERSGVNQLPFHVKRTYII